MGSTQSVQVHYKFKLEIKKIKNEKNFIFKRFRGLEKRGFEECISNLEIYRKEKAIQ